MKQTTVRELRFVSQVVFFGLFLFLLFKTAFRGSFQLAAGEVRLPYPVGVFLEADPLVALANALSTRALYRNLVWSLAILVPTFFLGRFFCGWICPMGSLSHFFGSFKSEKKRGAALIASNRYKRWQTSKYYILVTVLVAALFGSVVAGILDPISLMVRSLGVSLLPAVNYGVGAGLDALYGTGARPLRLLADGVQVLLQGSLASFKQPHFRQAFLLGAVFVLLMGLNLRVTRFWCRALCPLGALLGALSRWAPLGMVKYPDKCDDCRRCLLHCQGGDDPIPGAPWRKAECHLCFNCVGDCPTGGIAFSFFGERSAVVDVPQLQRRKLVTSLAAGVGLVPLLRATPALAGEIDPRLVRPPGALDERHFLERCIRCGACMKVCPNNALHPTLIEGGLEALWTPVLVPRIGYCEPSCVLCSQVCPTGAIWEISQAQKLGRLKPGNGKSAGEAGGDPIKIGTAFYDQGRCLPWSMATECIVCEEWCPTSPKAVYLQTVQVADPKGEVKTVRQPRVDPRLCTGCGACEFACPVRDRPAVYVTSVGETRSKTNQFILQRPPRVRT